MDKDTEKYIKLLKELNEARLDVIKALEGRVKALEELIILKDRTIELKSL